MTDITRRGVIAATGLAAPVLGIPGTLAAQPADTPHGISADPAQIAMDAYIYGYSLITTEVTRVQMTNVPEMRGMTAPMGQFINVRRYPPADYRGVSAPNADTLYSLAWLDLAEPMVFSHPDMGNRYFLFPMYDLWMPVVESPGTRTTGGGAATYLVTGPGWSGQVPAGMTQIKSPTRYMVILGRTYADGTDADYAAVNALQDQYRLVPLSAHGKPFTYRAPPVDPNPGFSMTDKPQTVILGMSAEEYFTRMARLMGGAAPPAAADAPILARMARIGIVPGQAFDASKLPAAARETLRDLPQRALAAIVASRPSLGREANGWIISQGLGRYGTDYMKRAVVAAFGWPANLEQDAVYPYTEVDADGRTLNGANRYTLTFPAGQTPPVNGFWSITMYEIDQGWWFVPNALNKFTVSPRNNLKANADGSTTLYFQRESPGADKESNWLPAPAGDFIPMLRMYWPKTETPSIINGSWAPPRVQRVA
jgi:hypothetical protein